MDAEDLPRLAGIAWRVRKDYNTHYAHCPGIGQMHRFILGVSGRLLVDHKNGDGLDNRKQNLRCATNAQNLCNRGKNSNNTTGYKGVSYYRRTGRYAANIGAGHKRFLGYFDTAEEAHKAYSEAAYKLHGDFAKVR